MITEDEFCNKYSPFRESEILAAERNGDILGYDVKYMETSEESVFVPGYRTYEPQEISGWTYSGDYFWGTANVEKVVPGGNVTRKKTERKNDHVQGILDASAICRNAANKGDHCVVSAILDDGYNTRLSIMAGGIYIRCTQMAASLVTVNRHIDYRNDPSLPRSTFLDCLWESGCASYLDIEFCEGLEWHGYRNMAMVFSAEYQDAMMFGTYACEYPYLHFDRDDIRRDLDKKGIDMLLGHAYHLMAFRFSRVDLLEYSADVLGYPDALTDMGRLYLLGRLGNMSALKDEARGEAYLERGASSGNGRSAYYLAWRVFETGRTDEALSLVQKYTYVPACDSLRYVIETERAGRKARKVKEPRTI